MYVAAAWRNANSAHSLHVVLVACVLSAVDVVPGTHKVVGVQYCEGHLHNIIMPWGWDCMYAPLYGQDKVLYRALVENRDMLLIRKTNQ